jgi:hypothetical protein
MRNCKFRPHVKFKPPSSIYLKLCISDNLGDIFESAAVVEIRPLEAAQPIRELHTFGPLLVKFFSSSRLQVEQFNRFPRLIVQTTQNGESKSLLRVAMTTNLI